MNAWFLTWEGTLGPGQLADNQIIAILSGRTSFKIVEALVDVIYCRSIYSAYDMTLLAKKRKDRENQYRLIGSQRERFLYGTPQLFIFSRKVSNLVVKRDESRKTETIRWEEPAYCVMRMRGSTPYFEEVQPAENKEIVRTIDEPLSPDFYDFYGI